MSELVEPKQLERGPENDLKTRGIGGLTITLWYRELTKDVYVEVIDDRQNECFQLEIPEGVHCNKVYDHPYTYRGTE